jgi:hypothetical protein
LLSSLRACLIARPLDLLCCSKLSAKHNPAMYNDILVAIIGVTGTVIGAVGAVVAARIQSARHVAAVNAAETAEPTPVLGESVDIRELRILRALFGEKKGRVLAAYQDSYYGPSLRAMIKKGWVKRIENRFYMTPKGAQFCAAYLKELLGNWQATSQIMK